MQLQPSLKETGSVCSNTKARERAAEGFITYIILQGMSKETKSVVTGMFIDS